MANLKTEANLCTAEQSGDIWDRLCRQWVS